MPQSPPPARAPADAGVADLPPGAADLDQAIAQAQVHTGAHWQVVCVQRAAPGHRATDVLAAAAGLAAACLAAALLPVADPWGESWDGIGPTARLLLTAAAGVVGLLLGAAVAGRSAALRRLVTPPGARAAAAASAARDAFDASHRPGDPATRVFVYAALAEQRVLVLVDAAGQRQLGDAGLATLCRLAAAPLARRSDAPLADLARGVHGAADHLAGHLADDLADDA